MKNRVHSSGRWSARHMVVGAVAVLGCAGLACCGSSKAESTPADGVTNVRVGANLNAGSLGTYVAIDKGYFAKHHLSVKLTPVLNLTLIPSQLGHQFDFGQSVQPILINSANSGLPVVATAGGEVESPDFVDGGVIVPKASGIKTAKDLSGKRVAVLTANGNNAFALKYWLKNQGVDPGSVSLTVVAPNNMLNVLKAKQVDAIYAVSPFASQALAGTANEMLVNPEIELGSKVSQGTITISNKTWAASHKQAVLEFEQAQVDAIAWIKANHDEALAILDKYTGSESAPGTKLPPLTATENEDDLKVWFKVMASVVPHFTPKMSTKDLLFQPIDGTNYTPQP